MFVAGTGGWGFVMCNLARWFTSLILRFDVLVEVGRGLCDVFARIVPRDGSYL